MRLPKIPSDMLSDLRSVVWSEEIGGAAPSDYRQHQRFKALQRRKLIKYFDRKRVRWDQTFYLATGLGHRVVAELGAR